MNTYKPYILYNIPNRQTVDRFEELEEAISVIRKAQTSGWEVYWQGRKVWWDTPGGYGLTAASERKG